MGNFFFDLQRFAEGGGTGSGNGGDGGAMGGAAPTQERSPQAEAPVAGANVETANTGESFDELIKGRYKADYDARVQATIQDRLKNSKARESALAPMLEAIAKEYGVDPTDAEALNEAYLNDPRRYEKEAIEQGISPETAARLAKLKRAQDAEAQRKQAEAQAAAEAKQQQDLQNHYNGLQQQAENLKQLYPGFDLDTELKNPQFLKMTAPGMDIDVRTAYEAIHRDELRGAEMQYATNRTASRISAAVQAGQRRPAENGVNRQSVAVNIVNDPSRMTREQRSSYVDRAMHGERVTWDMIRGGK